MKKVIKEIIPYIVIIVVALLIKTYIISPIKVIGDSMKSTLLHGDIMLLDKITYRFKDIKRFDIVVINIDNKDIIKRVIGLPGDTVEIIDNELIINGQKIDENYLGENVTTNDYNILEYLGSEKVPKNQYFVLGDNREVSADSRILGFIKRNDIEGKAILTIFPFSRIGNKK